MINSLQFIYKLYYIDILHNLYFNIDIKKDKRI